MALTSNLAQVPREIGSLATWGMFWLIVACVGATLYFDDGLAKLGWAWARPEYSHGPLIPVLSGLLFLRQLKSVPIDENQTRNRWPGLAVMLFAVLIGLLGNLAKIDDVVTYALIIWVWGILLISFGWKVGLLFWPPVLHLVYMLPLPDVMYYKFSTWLQLISSELGVTFLQWFNVPVYLEGNIIDLGVYKLHVAEACSGLRYLFPILSFSYIFAVLYQGPIWHKAILLISAAPITVFMNSLRIAIAGIIVDRFGLEHVEGFSHFFEGWVIFIACVLILFGLAWVMLHLQRKKMSLSEALDLDTTELGPQFMRLRLLQASPALIAGATMMVAFGVAWQMAPEPTEQRFIREPFAAFPQQLGAWQSGPPQTLSPKVYRALGADDYHQVDLRAPNQLQPVGLFMAWYADQSDGGVHSPEVCLPGSGWEIAWLERTDIANDIGYAGKFNINRAIIQKGSQRMMVYYWFEQKGRKVAWDMAAKFYLMVDGISTGQTDGAMLRLTTAIDPSETDAAAEARLRDVLVEMLEPLPSFIPGSGDIGR